MGGWSLAACLFVCIAVLVHGQQDQGEVNKALRESSGAGEGHLESSTELTLFLVIITVLVGLSIMLETLEHFLRHWTAPEVQVILTVLYGELTTFGTVGILFFVAESTGILHSVGTAVFGKTHSEALVERVERVDKILLLLMLCFVATCLVLVWRAALVTTAYTKHEAMAKSPQKTLDAAVEALRGDQAAAAAYRKRITDISASSRQPKQASGADPTTEQDSKPKASAGAMTADAAIDAVSYLSLRHQFLFRLRRQRSPPITASFDFATYLAFTLGKDMANVVQVQPAAWLVLLVVVYAVSPITLAGSALLDLVAFVAVGCLPLGLLLFLQSHAREAKFLLTDPTLLMEVTRRAALPMDASGAESYGDSADSAGSGPADSVLHRRGASAIPTTSATDSAASEAAVATLGDDVEDDGFVQGRDQAVTPRVAKHWPKLYGSDAPYRRNFGSGRNHSDMMTRIILPIVSPYSMISSSQPGGAHDSVLLFSRDANANYSFLLTCLSLFNSVYACILIGSVSFVLVSLLGVGLGLLSLLGLLLPSVAFGFLLPAVVADISLITSVEELSRPELIRQAIVSRQAALAQSAVKVLACLANSKKMLAASKWTKEKRASKLAKAKAELGVDGVRAAEAEAKRMFGAFVSSHDAELSLADLRLLLKSLRVIGVGGTTEDDEIAVQQVLDAMDLDALDEAEERTVAMRGAIDGAATSAGVDNGETEAMVKEQTVSQAEFIQWFITAGPGSPMSADDDLQELVDGVMAVLDADGDGGVSLTELRDVLGEVDPGIDVEAVLASWDKDHNGILERDELFQVFSESLHA